MSDATPEGGDAEDTIGKQGIVEVDVGSDYLGTITVLLKLILDGLPQDVWPPTGVWRAELESALDARPTHEWSDGEGSVMAAIATFIASR
ncbi:hypothetical protein MSTE_03605 [Mycobacteroides stephanolepidis]|uniref:Uncharacterized protein n=1 Tax=[Mycobacterium] stephanolepidis TaxID=1520670 RepID=A0A1Z4F0Z0_9MYCO|nr:hypothetical protein MSTE_03605 [[Mycobacterium] stephanolepidis]